MVSSRSSHVSAMMSFFESTRLMVCARKSPLYAVLIELMTAPALRIPNQTGRNSAQFGSMTETDSPGCTPRAISPFATWFACALTVP